MLFVEKVVHHGAVSATSSQHRRVDGVPCQRTDLLLVTFEEEDVAHHAYVEDSRHGISCAGSEQYAICGLELRHRDGVLVPM